MFIVLLIGGIAILSVIEGTLTDAVAGLALLVVTGALLSSYRPDARIDRIESLLERIADAVAPVESVAMAMKPGYWHVELDDGTGADRSATIDGAAQLTVGEVIPKAEGGRDYRIDRVEPDRMYAHAVPHE